MFKPWLKEFRLWRLSILELIPGRVGEYLRNFLYGYRCGPRVRVLKGVIIHHPQNLIIGADSGVSSGTQINAAAGITIGKDVLIGPNCIIWSQNHRYSSLETEIRNQGYEYSPVTIDDGAWIAASCVILPGVIVGKGCVIAAGSVLTKSTPPGAIVAGVPGKVIGMRNDSERDTALRSI